MAHLGVVALATLPGAARASSDGYGALVDLDVGTVEEIRLGYDAGRLGIGARLGQGPALRLSSGRLVPAGVVGIFGSIGVDNTEDPFLTLEPLVGVGVVFDEYIHTAFAGGATLGLRFTEHSGYGQKPWVGARVGAELLLGPGTLVLPDVGVVLSW